MLAIFVTIRALCTRRKATIDANCRMQFITIAYCSCLSQSIRASSERGQL